MRYVFLILLNFILFACSTSTIPTEPNKKELELWIQNGIVLLPDGHTDEVDIFINNGIITDVIPSEEVIADQITSTQRIDAGKNFVMPGLIDAHAHFISLGKNQANLDFLGTTSWDEILQLVANRVKDTPNGTWITGRGWHQEKWKNLPEDVVEGFPTHALLTKISPNHPVYLTHASGHGLIANAKAMELAGINKNTSNPEGGIILRDNNGQATGIFQENAMELIHSVYQDSRKAMTEDEKDEEWMSYLQLAEQECLSQGITTVHDAGISWTDAKKFKHLAEKNQLNLRLYSMLADNVLHDTPIDVLQQHIESTRNNKFFTNTAVKAYMDGALGSRGAWLIEDYSDLPGYKGENVTSMEYMHKTAQIAEELNLQLCIHAIGDRGNREVINVFEEVMGSQLKKARWRIEHAQHLNPLEIDRIANLDIIASMQTVHCTSDAPYVEKRLGAERAEQGAYVWQTLLDKGVTIANGTDAPIERINPFENIYAAVTRKRLDNGFTFYPNQKLSRAKALEIYTQGNAFAAFQESWKGKIQKGYVADIIILDTNLLSCDELEIPKTQVLYTLIEGKIKYQKNKLLHPSKK